MKLIPTEFLVPGMTLEEDVVTKDNKVLAGRATILTDKVISKLEANHIEAVQISTETFHSDPAPVSAQPTADAVSAVPVPEASGPKKDGYSETVKKAKSSRLSQQNWKKPSRLFPNSFPSYWTGIRPLT